MSKLKSLAAAVTLAVAGLGSVAPAQAWELIDWNGTQVWGQEWTPGTALPWVASDEIADLWYRVYFDGRVGTVNNVVPGLASSVLYQLREVSDDRRSWTFDFSVYNATGQGNVGAGLDANLTVFGFNIDPNVSGVTLTSTVFDTRSGTSLGRSGTVPLGQPAAEICFIDKQGGVVNNCTGGDGNGGVAPGQYGYGAFTLSFAAIPPTTFGPPSIALSQPFVRYQSIDGNGLRDESGVGLPVAWVPEPTTWSLMIFGFGTAGAMLRRRRVSIA